MAALLLKIPSCAHPSVGAVAVHAARLAHCYAHQSSVEDHIRQWLCLCLESPWRCRCGVAGRSDPYRSVPVHNSHCVMQRGTRSPTRRCWCTCKWRTRGAAALRWLEAKSTSQLWAGTSLESWSTSYRSADTSQDTVTLPQLLHLQSLSSVLWAGMSG